MILTVLLVVHNYIDAPSKETKLCNNQTEISQYDRRVCLSDILENVFSMNRNQSLKINQEKYSPIHQGRISLSFEK